MSRWNRANHNSDVLAVALTFTHVALLAACTGGGVTDTASPVTRTGGNRPPIVTSAIILDSPLSKTAPATVLIQTEDPEREAVSFQYQWYADNTPIAGQTGATLPGELLRRGQTVFVEVVPTDGANKGQPYRTKSVMVGNTAPKVMAVVLTPQIARTGDQLNAQVEAVDLDQDRVDVTYKWYRNDAVIKEGEEAFLDTTGFAVRDKIVVEVTAQDSAGSGNSLKSEPFELGNSGPKIVSMPPASVVEEHFDYSVKAIDPDEDQLTYHLEIAPTGMVISAESGHIRWLIPINQQGTFHVKVVAKDGQGGLASQEFDVTLPAAAPTTTPGA